ncbi:MAG TPA: GNAT family N-acetyltransferase [Anaerolineaceae bacterium]
MIRPYQPSDLTACRALWVELTERHRQIYRNPDIGGADLGSHFDQYLTRPDLVDLWVAEEEGQVIGLVGLLQEGEEMEIEPVIVQAAYRSRGIGSALVAQAIMAARQHGCHYLNVRPVMRNVEAIQFFYTAGFEILGRVELFQDFQPEGHQWQEGIPIHGHLFKY